MKKITKLFSILIVLFVVVGCSPNKELDLTKVRVGDLRSEFWLPLL